jgi:L-glutaminase (EC 3.5.1.2)
MIKLSADVVNALKKGDNLIAAQCKNPVGNGLLDFGLLVQKEMHTALEKTAVQKSVDVQATQTHYTFVCGEVDLKLTFSAPLFMDDLNLLTRPVNYITYQVVANDGKAHDVQVYFEASPRWALDQPYQESVSQIFEDNGLLFLKSGSKEQNILAKKGDDLRIDWGYFYLVAEKNNVSVNIGESNTLRTNFVNNVQDGQATTGENEKSKMSLTHNLGSVESFSGKVMIGYDDIYSIQYFGDNLRPYWNQDGNQTIAGQFHAANKEYDKLIEKCYAFD